MLVLRFNQMLSIIRYKTINIRYANTMTAIIIIEYKFIDVFLNEEDTIKITTVIAEVIRTGIIHLVNLILLSTFFESHSISSLNRIKSGDWNSLK